MAPNCSTHSCPNGECVVIVIPLFIIGLDALVLELAFLLCGIALAVDVSPSSCGATWVVFPFLFGISDAS